MKPFGLTSFATAALSTLFATQVTATLQPIVIKVRPQICEYRRTYHANSLSRDPISSTRTVPSSSFVVLHTNKTSAQMVPHQAHHPSRILSQTKLDARVMFPSFKSSAQMSFVFTPSMPLSITPLV